MPHTVPMELFCYFQFIPDLTPFSLSHEVQTHTDLPIRERQKHQSSTHTWKQ